LPSYQQFNYRLNRLEGAIQRVASNLTSSFIPEGCDQGVSLVDFLPIVTYKGRNKSGKVALELADKGYCSTKNMFYHGMKLYALAFRRKGGIPFPEYLTCTPASVNDLEAFKLAFGDSLNDRVVFGDKSYCDNDYFQEKEATINRTMFTPHKNVKGESDVIRMREQASNDLFSKAVSTVAPLPFSLYLPILIAAERKNQDPKCAKGAFNKGITYAYLWKNRRCVHLSDISTLDSHYY